MPTGTIWAIEIKSGLRLKPSKGFYNATSDIGFDLNFSVYAGKDSYPIAENIKIIPLPDIMQLLEK